MRIFTVTLNPSLDRTLSVPALVAGTLHRARVVRNDLGGKGINVSRALRALGVSSCVVGVFGGRTGHALRDGLRGEGYEVEAIEVGEETRQNSTLYDESSGVYTKVNELGPRLDVAELERIESRVERLARRGDCWALCGSLPPGAHDDLYARLISRLRAAGALALLDASGAALERGVRAGPYAVKPNVEEAAALLQVSISEEDEEGARGAVERIACGDTAMAMLTMGSRGLLLAAAGQLWRAVPPNADIRSPVGAGDAALAGLLWAMGEQCDPQECARRAAACGTAAAMQEGTGVGDARLVHELMPLVKMSRW